MIQQFGPIAFGKKSGAAFVAMASGDPNISDPSSVIPKEDLNAVNWPWALWGANNNLPAEMVKAIEACGVLSAAIDGKARFGMGKGPKPFKVLQVNADGSEDRKSVV